MLDRVEGGVDAVGAVDPEGGDALVLADLLQVAGVAAVEAAHHQHQVQSILRLHRRKKPRDAMATSLATSCQRQLVLGTRQQVDARDGHAQHSRWPCTSTSGHLSTCLACLSMGSAC